MKRLLLKTASFFDAELDRLLYVSLLKPHLKLVVPVRNHYFKKTLRSLRIFSNIKAIILVPGLSNDKYEEWLNK